MEREHEYNINVEWTGNEGYGTKDYRSYNRNYNISSEYKPLIKGTTDPLFRGDKKRYNPEELLVAALSSCHMLWYLHLCSRKGVIVEEYSDNAVGNMVEASGGDGHFTEVVLNPVVVVRDESMIEKANSLHLEARELCFIANSCNFPVYHNPVCRAKNYQLKKTG